jgi:hypothetical protein
MTRSTENLINNIFFRRGMEAARCGHSIDSLTAPRGLARKTEEDGWHFYHGHYTPSWPIDCKPSIAWGE